MLQAALCSTIFCMFLTIDDLHQNPKIYNRWREILEQRDGTTFSHYILLFLRVTRLPCRAISERSSKSSKQPRVNQHQKFSDTSQLYIKVAKRLREFKIEFRVELRFG